MSVLSAGFLVVLLTVAVQSQENKYTTRFDSIDLDRIIKSDRLLRNYINCAVDKGHCTPDGNELKRVLPDALKTYCSKCSQKQREGTVKVLRHLVTNRRDWFNELASKYDPDGSYMEKYRAEYAKDGIVF